MKEKTRTRWRWEWVGVSSNGAFWDISVVCFIKLVFVSPAHIRTNPSESTSSSLSVLPHTATIIIASFLLPCPTPAPWKKREKTNKNLPAPLPSHRFPRAPSPAGIRNVEEPLTQFSPHYLYYFKSLIITIIFSLLRSPLLIILRFCFPTVPSTVHTIHASFSDRYFSLFIFLEFFFSFLTSFAML